MDYDRTDMPKVYDAGRSYAPHVLDHWLETIAASVGSRSVETILDLGCGTGRYSSALAERFEAYVHAIDPSELMLGKAREKCHPRVRYERSAGEQLPLPGESIDLVFMSMVFHHFSEPERVARECRRVLRPAGLVCLRAGTLEQVPTYPQFKFFPESSPIFAALLQTKEFVVETFAKAGLACTNHELVESETAANWHQFADKVSHGADSVLSQLGDDEFSVGLERLRRHARTRPKSEPVTELIDFFVFGRDD